MNPIENQPIDTEMRTVRTIDLKAVKAALELAQFLRAGVSRHRRRRRRKTRQRRTRNRQRIEHRARNDEAVKTRLPRADTRGGQTLGDEGARKRAPKVNHNQPRRHQHEFERNHRARRSAAQNRHRNPRSRRADFGAAARQRWSATKRPLRARLFLLLASRPPGKRATRCGAFTIRPSPAESESTNRWATSRPR